MEVQIKEIDYCKLEVLYKADPSVVAEKKEEVVSKFRGIQIPGFRKGKAPDSAIRLSLAKEISVNVAEQMKAQAYDDAVFEIESKPIGYPQFEDVSISGNNFSCKMTILKKPDFELGNFKYQVKNPIIEKDADTEVKESLRDLSIRFGDVEPYGDNDFVETGDQVTISFDASIDGKPFEGSFSEGQLYTVGQNSLKDFDDNLLGMSAGESRKFEIFFPESYPEIGGKTAQFEVTLNMGTKRIPCALDDNLAKQCGEQSFKDLEDKLSQIAQAKVKQSRLIKLRQEIAAKLVQEHDFKVPEFLENLEAQHISLQNGIDYSLLDDSEKDVFKKQAEKQVKLSLILDSVREQEPDSVLSDAEANNGIIKRAKMRGLDPKTYFVEAQKNGSLIGLLAGLKDEFTMQWIVDQAIILD